MARTYTNIIAALNFSLEPFCKRLLWMDDFVSTMSADWAPFQTTFDPDAGALPPTYKNSRAACARSTGGRYHYLDGLYRRSAPPIAGSGGSSVE